MPEKYKESFEGKSTEDVLNRPNVRYTDNTEMGDRGFGDMFVERRLDQSIDYFSMCEGVDLQIGKVLQKLKDGSWCEGSMAASQSGRFRGQPGGFRTFIENLYMCSSAIVGGGGIGRGSSFNCYQAIAEDFGLPRPKH